LSAEPEWSIHPDPEITVIRLLGRKTSPPLQPVSLMSVATPISEVAIRSSIPVIVPAWFEVHRQDLPIWNELLLRSGASLYQ
jgi:hypothetical protein